MEFVWRCLFNHLENKPKQTTLKTQTVATYTEKTAGDEYKQSGKTDNKIGKLNWNTCIPKERAENNKTDITQLEHTETYQNPGAEEIPVRTSCNIETAQLHDSNPHAKNQLWTMQKITSNLLRKSPWTNSELCRKSTREKHPIQ